MSRGDPFFGSVMARSALSRLAFALVVIAGLWATIAWAVSLP